MYLNLEDIDIFYYNMKTKKAPDIVKVQNTNIITQSTTCAIYK